jgi:ADP-ribose pyrophosphatase YjhB (NUDIX family)
MITMRKEHMASALFALSIMLYRQQCKGWCSRNAAMSDNCKKEEESLATSSKLKYMRTDDECQSLFYSGQIMEEGKGFPASNTVDCHTIDRLKTVHPQYIRLSKELYGGIVANIPTVCVDIILQREVDDKVLLFYRRDKPAKGLWWLPGGRMLKGETFFETALRKVRDEMGHGSKLNGQVEAVAVTNVWNTFFHDSSWDSDREEGKEGCQTVNISVFCRLKTTDVLLHEVSAGESSEWAVEAYRWVPVEELLQPGNYDKYVRVNAECARMKGLI